MCKLPSWNPYAWVDHSPMCPDGCVEQDEDTGWSVVRELHNDDPSIMITLEQGKTTAQQLINALNTIRPGSVLTAVDTATGAGGAVSLLVYLDNVA